MKDNNAWPIARNISTNAAVLDGKSKAKLIREFIENNSDRAFFSKELTKAFKGNDAKPSDIMTIVSRLEQKGLFYVGDTGYKTDKPHLKTATY